MKEIVSIKNEFKGEIDNLWKNPKFSKISIIKNGYGSQDEIIKDSILFIGINPSFTNRDKPGKYFINLDQEGKRTEDGKPYVAYFNKFVDITFRLNKNQNSGEDIKWSHMDLLFHRETKQSLIDKLKKEENGIEFISEQLKISKKIILKSKPKIIVVSNAKARNFLKGKEDKKLAQLFDFKFDEKLGTEIIKDNPNLDNTPVFFTSMLSGQRALDNGSYERLIWHIGYVLNKIGN